MTSNESGVRMSQMSLHTNLNTTMTNIITAMLTLGALV
jgi:hypothetical protein